MKEIPENGIISAERAPRSTHTRYPVTQEQIDEIVQNDLSDYAFPVHPTYNPRIRDNGKTVASVHPSGRCEIKEIIIGKQDSPERDFLVDTILHEWLEADIMIKQWKDPAYKKLHVASDAARHKWIYAEIKAYFERRGGK